MKETKEKIQQYILGGITSEDETLLTDMDKLQYALKRFKSEYDHMILRVGKRKAFAEWLSGLALDYDYTNHDILKLANDWEQPTKTEAQQDNILNSWWDFLTHQFFKLYNQEIKKHYVMEVLPTDEVGSFKINVIESEQENKNQVGLWMYNSAREHDNLKPLKRLPSGTTFKRLYEVE